eukprot:1492813-Amphidinium_carterae.1
MRSASSDSGRGEVGTPFPGRLCEVLAQTEPATGIDSSTVYVRSEASSPSVVDKVCPTPVAACPKQMQQYLLGESTDKRDYGMSPLPIRCSLVGRVAAGIGQASALIVGGKSFGCYFCNSLCSVAGRDFFYYMLEGTLAELRIVVTVLVTCPSLGPPASSNLTIFYTN